MNHLTVGVYLNQTYVTNVVKDQHLAGHISYNETYRPGRMLFVDGKYKCGGLLHPSELKEMISIWESKISKFNVNLSQASEDYI